MTPQTPQPLRRYPRQPLLAAAFLCSGAPLVISIVTHLSLAVTLAAGVAVAALIVFLKWTRGDAHSRALIKATLVTGLIAGVASTAAYDGVRILLVQLGHMKFYPFETFNRFGELLIGYDSSRAVNMSVGTGYHLLNGIAFATSYCFMFGGRSWWFGVLWALGLEAMMFTTYTNWLDLEEVMAEFVAVSLVGHLAYGTTFGLIGQYQLRPERLPRAPSPDASGSPA